MEGVSMSSGIADIRDRITELRRVPANSIIPHPNNWRRHPEHQRNVLQGMLAAVGIANAVLVREDAVGLHLIDGHLRVELFGDQKIPVLILDVTEEEANKLLVTLDPLAAMATQDKDVLTELLRSIHGDADMETVLTAIAKETHIAMSSLSDHGADPGADESEADHLRGKWGVMPGQLWQVGKHRLLCGDALNPVNVALLLDGETPNLMVTDPPYGVEYDANWRNEAADEGYLSFGPRRVAPVANDNRADWSDAYRLFPGKVLYAWSPPGDLMIITGLAIQVAGFDIRSGLVWSKPHFPISRGHYNYQHEPCWYAVRKGHTADWIGPMNASSVWELPLDKNIDGGHSTQKPLECMARPIRNHEGDVYDPFLGSGTTMVAAEQLGRVCYGMDIEPGYVAITLERMAKMGLEPTLMEGA